MSVRTAPAAEIVMTRWNFFHASEGSLNVFFREIPEDADRVVRFTLIDNQSWLHLVVELRLDRPRSSAVLVVGAVYGSPSCSLSKSEDLRVKGWVVPEWYDMLLADAKANFAGYFDELSS